MVTALHTAPGRVRAEQLGGGARGHHPHCLWEVCQGAVVPNTGEGWETQVTQHHD